MSLKKKGNLRLLPISKEDAPDQPLHIDEMVEAIKCHWCPTWGGSQAVKVINQHVRTYKCHVLTAQNKELNLPQPEESGVQKIITDFFKTL